MSYPEKPGDDARTSTMMTSTSEKSAFVEYETVMQLVAKLTTPYEESSSVSLAESDSAVARLRQIFDKYQEFPTLLDRHLEGMVYQLATAARATMDQDDSILLASSWTRFYSSSLPRLCSVLYLLSKVRGRKRVQKFLPHRVEDVHAVWRTLNGVDELFRKDGAQETTAPPMWETLYVLWNWMGMLSLVPAAFPFPVS